MATAFARSSGANARPADWDEAPQSTGRGRGNWLPLDALDEEELFTGTPQLHAMPAAAPRRRVDWLRPTAPQQQRQAAAQPSAQRSARPEISVKSVQVKTLAVTVGVIALAFSAYLAFSAALDWTRVRLDDLQYGRPRTMQLDAYVGQHEAEGMPSHFVAMNLNRRVTVLHLPGGDPSQVRTIIGPYLFGEGEDLTPVELDVRDVNTDSKPDLIVSVKSEQLLYLNDGEAFRLTTAEERAAIERANAPVPAQPQGQAEVQQEGGTK